MMKKKDWRGLPGKTYSSYKNASTETVFKDFIKSIEYAKFPFGSEFYVFQDIPITKEKDKIRLRCQYSYYKCNAKVYLTRTGCLDWFRGFIALKDACWSKGMHNQAGHNEAKGKKGITGEEVGAFISNQEIIDLLTVKQLRASEIYTQLSPKLDEDDIEGAENLMKRIKKLGKLFTDESIEDNVIKSTPKFKMPNIPQPYCRYDHRFHTEKGRRSIILFSTPFQSMVLKNYNTFLIDGWFKVRINNFLQLITVSVFKECTYVAVCHMLLQDKDLKTYIEAFSLFKASVDKDTNFKVDWQEKTVLTDFETGLRAAATKVFRPRRMNGCHFHYCKALWDNFYSIFSRPLSKKQLRLYRALKRYPFLSSVIDQFELNKAELLERLFAGCDGDAEERLQFKAYFDKQWKGYSFDFSESERTIQRTTNGLECLHSVFKQKNLNLDKDFQIFVQNLAKLDRNLLIDSEFEIINAPYTVNLKWSSVSGESIMEETHFWFSKTLEYYETAEEHERMRQLEQREERNFEEF